MSKSLLNNPDYLSQVLHMLSSNQSDVIKQGEKLLKPFLKNSGCIIALIIQITQSTDQNIRLQASLLLKQRILKLYPKCRDSDKSEIRSQLLQMLVSDQQRPVGIAIAGSVASLAKSIVVKEKGQVPELFQVLTELSQHPNERLRSLNYSLLAQLAEQISKYLLPHTSSLCNMMIMGCEDKSADVSVEAMKASSIYTSNISNHEEVMLMKPILSPIIEVLVNCLNRGDQDLVIEGLEIFQEACEMEFPLINDHIEVLIPLLMRIIQSDQIDYPLKAAACATFNLVIENRPKLVGKKQLVSPCLEALVTILIHSRESAAGSIFAFMSEDKSNLDGEENDDEEKEDLPKLAQTSINCMAISLPSKYFVQPAISVASECINSSDAHMRKAGCALLGIIIEGCSDSIVTLLHDIVPRLTMLYQDPEVLVRECASFAIGQLAEHTQPDILHYHHLILPAILQGLEDPSNTVQGISCYVAEMYVENLEPSTLRPVLNVLITKLLTLLQNTNKVGREVILAAIAATAIAAETDFIPYLDNVVSILSSFLFIDDPKMFEIRGRALECLGHIAIAVGEKHFKYFDLGMQSVMQSTHIEHESLKEFSYIYLANVAKAMNSAFASYLPTLVPHLLDVINESELSALQEEDEEEEEEEVGAAQQVDDDEFDDFEINVEEGFVNTKKAAITAIGALSQYTKQEFFPFLEVVMKAIIGEDSGVINSYHAPIRTEALSSLQYFTIVAKSKSDLHHITTDMIPIGLSPLPIAEGTVLHTVLHVVMNTYLKTIFFDESREAVAMALDGIKAVLEEFGVAALMVKYESVETEKPSDSATTSNELIATKLMSAILDLLNEQTYCQTKKETSEEEDDDHEKLVIDSTADVIGSLARFIGPAFVPYFDTFVPPLLKYLKPTRTYNDRSMVIGIFSEVILHIGVDSFKYLELVLPSIQVGLQDQTVEGIRRNSAFCIATIVQSLHSLLSQNQILQFLSWLQPLCTRNNLLQQGMHNVAGADVDNALSAVARMITTLPNFIPLPSVLPVMLASLPLRVDPEEGLSVYGCIISLVRQGEVTAMQLFPQILHLLGFTLISESKAINAKTKDLIRSSLKEFYVSPNILPFFNNAIQQLASSPDNALVIQCLQQTVSN